MLALLQLITPLEATTEQLRDVHTEEYLSQLHSSSAKVSRRCTRRLRVERVGSSWYGAGAASNPAIIQFDHPTWRSRARF